MQETKIIPGHSFKQVEEGSLKELVLKIKEYSGEIKRNWLLIILICIPFLAWQLFKAATMPTRFKATLTYMVDDDKGSSLGGVSAILGNFGIGDSKSNLDKVIALSKSRNIIQTALLTRDSIGSQFDFLANHLIEGEHFRNDYWSGPDFRIGNGMLSDVVFKTNAIEGFTRAENAALQDLHEYIVGGTRFKGIMYSAFDKKSGIMTLSIVSKSEELAIKLTLAIYEKLSSYYVESAIEGELLTYNILKEKTDSIGYLLNNTEYKSALFRDQTNMLLLNKDKLPAERYSRNKALYTLMYGEAVKNLELADFALKSKTPYIQVVDTPFAPIIPMRPSFVKMLAVGLILGFFVGIVFVLLRNFVRNLEL